MQTKNIAELNENNKIKKKNESITGGFKNHGAGRQ